VSVVALGAPIVLRDRPRVRLRQGHSSDRQPLLRGFERLSPESRYRRFLVAMPEQSEEKVRYLTESDRHDHEAIIALAEPTGDGRRGRNITRPGVMRGASQQTGRRRKRNAPGYLGQPGTRLSEPAFLLPRVFARIVQYGPRPRGEPGARNVRHSRDSWDC
jgi:hypothetical protein